jgi:hypothetical protein
MKYLITESQLDKTIFKYLDNQDFIKFEKDGRIYFVNSEDDEYSILFYDKSNDDECYVYHKLIDEISSFFSLSERDSKKIIKDWVENTLQVNIKYLISISHKSAMEVELTNIITESQLDTFLLRRFTMDELKGLKDDYDYVMDEEDFEDSADRDDYVYELLEKFIDRHKGEEFLQYGDDTEFYAKRSDYIRALLKFLHSD